MNKGRYSKYLRPTSFFLDLILVLFLPFIFLKDLNINFNYFELFLLLSWIFVSFKTKFYEIYRFTTPVEIFSKLTKQAVLFLLIVIAYFPFFKTTTFSIWATILYIFVLIFLVTILKILAFYYLKKYRLITGNNLRNVVIIGYTEETINLKKIFNKRPDYGYQFKGFFSDKKSNDEITGKIPDLKAFIKDNKIDEIYCSVGEVSNEKQKELVILADDNLIEIKFIPDSKFIFSKNTKIDYFEHLPVLSLQKSPLDNYYTELFKRIFDIVFSSIVIVLVLSWLIPILGLIIRFQSKGNIFFKQSRPGLNEQEFICYKFRSMQINTLTETEASRNDPRVTKIGKFMRKTSIDELPQFFNVFFGDMSVVGPRPHLWSQNKTYGTKIKKYMVRHYVKPGITGLAQVKGYRGEIETDEDMINRVKFDIFYIENWSMFMDVKIIVQTIVNVFKGEEKAY